MMTINSYSDLKALVEKETRSDSLFHVTRNWIEVLKDGYLKGSFMNHIERDLMRKVMGDTGLNVERYISFGRSIQSSAYIAASAKFEDFAVVFEFDRNSIRRRHRVVPVNWHSDSDQFSPEASSRSKGYAEAEDRLVLPKGKESLDIKPYLTAVHILSNTIERHREIERKIVEKRKSIDKLKKEYNVATSKNDVKQTEEIDRQIEWVEGLIDSLLDQINHLEANDHKRIMAIPKLAEDYPNIPFYVYAKHGDWIAKRFSEADQMNPNLPGYHDEEDDD